MDFSFHLAELKLYKLLILINAKLYNDKIRNVGNCFLIHSPITSDKAASTMTCIGNIVRIVINSMMLPFTNIFIFFLLFSVKLQFYLLVNIQMAYT